MATKTATPKTNIFEQAKSNPVKPAARVKDDKKVVKTPGLEMYALVDSLQKALEAVKDGMKGDLNDHMFDQFLENRGENYKGEENSASASLELRKRASTSALKPLEVQLLKENGIPMIDIAGEFKLNIDGVSAKKLQEVSDAIGSISGLPENFLVYDASKAKTITAEDSIEAAFKLNDADSIRAVLEVVGVPSIKPKTSKAFEDVLAEVSKHMKALDVDSILADFAAKQKARYAK